MAPAAAEHVFSIPYRYLWNTQFTGDIQMSADRPTGLARFVGDAENQLLKVLSDNNRAPFVNFSNRHIWPIVLFGSGGTGKTSLALTILSELSSQFASDSSRSHSPDQESEKPVFMTALDFDRRFRSAMETDSVHDFRQRLLRCPGVMIDDVHLLAKKPAAQVELLLLVERMLRHARPLILTLNQSPQLENDLIPQLTSRLCGGLSLPVEPPGQAARRVIIEDLSKIHRLNLTEQSRDFLVGRLNVTVPKIVHFFQQLVIQLQTQKDFILDQPINNDLLLKMFQRSDQDLKKMAQLIIKRVAKEYLVKPADLACPSRKQSTVMARAVAVYFNRELLGTSFGKIGALFGNRDHSTIMHAYRKIHKLLDESSDQLATDPTAIQTRKTIKKLHPELLNHFACQFGSL